MITDGGDQGTPGSLKYHQFFMVEYTLFITGGVKNGKATSEVWAFYTKNEVFEKLTSMRT